MTQKEINDAEWRNPANWHAGWLNIYWSKRDTRVFIPKRHPILGFALNLARPVSILLLSLLFLVIIGLAFVSIFHPA
jgi:uncharacterized membrane protein